MVLDVVNMVNIFKGILIWDIYSTFAGSVLVLGFTKSTPTSLSYTISLAYNSCNSPFERCVIK